MKFKTVYEFIEIDSIPGSRFKDERQLIIDDEGNEVLKTVGKTDLQASIDSHKESVDLNLMLQRYANGDDSIIDKVKGFYADITSLPINLMEVMNTNIRGKELFDSLDPEIKSVFGNNYMTFLAEPERFNKYMDKKNKDVNNAVSEEVSEDE